MDNLSQASSLPEKVLARHAEILRELLPEFRHRVVEEGRPADTLLNHYLRGHRELGSRDRRFLAQALFSYFRWMGWTIGRMELDDLSACLVGAALDADVLAESFRYIGGRCNLPFGLEPLGAKTFADKRDTLNDQLRSRAGFAPLQATDLVPPAFATEVDPALADRCIEHFQQRPPAWFRARNDASRLTDSLSAAGIPFTRHGRAGAAFAVEGGTSLALALKGHEAQYVVQDISSQCVGLVCAPQAGEEWWDACAGAGGKALHLMDLMGQAGKVLATDVRLAAMKELKKRARHYGIRHIRTQPFNAVNDEPFRKTFDGVLVDAPCSGWGTWGRNPDARWRTSRGEVGQCANRQTKMLSNVTWCVRPGGTLVYSVCSLTRPETEEVVMNFLEQHPHFALEPFTHPLTGEPTSGQAQIWPWEGPGDAMFIARFRRAD